MEQNIDGTVGGSYFSLLYLIERLNRQKYEPYVIFYNVHTLVDNFRNAGCKVIIWKRSTPLIFKKKFPLLEKTNYSMFLFALRLLRIFWSAA